MFELFITLFTGGGAMGIGSILKIVAGKLDSGSFKQETDSKVQALKDILTHAVNGNLDKETIELFVNALTEDTEGGMFGRHTRRILAIMGVSVIALGTIHCVLFAGDPFITIPSIALGGESSGGWSFLWGVFTLPPKTSPIQLTLGHLAAVNFISLNMILGFYFTPGGRR
jgi:hypothetical protein